MIPDPPPKCVFVQHEELMAEKQRAGFHPPLRTLGPKPMEPKGVVAKIFKFKR